MSDTNLAAVIGALGTTGIETAQLAEGQPVSVTSVGGVGVVSTGAAVTPNAFGPILTVLAVLFVVILIINPHILGS